MVQYIQGLVIKWLTVLPILISLILRQVQNFFTLKIYLQKLKAKQKVNKMAKGLYDNIHAKRKRIAAGSKETMRKVGAKGAPTAKAFKKAKKTVKK